MLHISFPRKLSSKYYTRHTAARARLLEYARMSAISYFSQVMLQV